MVGPDGTARESTSRAGRAENETEVLTEDAVHCGQGAVRRHRETVPSAAWDHWSAQRSRRVTPRSGVSSHESSRNAWSVRYRKNESSPVQMPTPVVGLACIQRPCSFYCSRCGSSRYLPVKRSLSPFFSFSCSMAATLQYSFFPFLHHAVLDGAGGTPFSSA